MSTPSSLAERNRQYWRANIKLLSLLLSIWFFVSFICSILLVDVLDQIQFFGFKLGFWMAQQGSIYVFVALIFIYAWKMNKLEKRYGLDEDSASVNPQAEGEL